MAGIGVETEAVPVSPAGSAMNERIPDWRSQLRRRSVGLGIRPRCAASSLDSPRGVSEDRKTPASLRCALDAPAMSVKTRAQNALGPPSRHPPYDSPVVVESRTVKVRGWMFVPPGKRKDGSPVREEFPKKP